MLGDDLGQLIPNRVHLSPVEEVPLTCTFSVVSPYTNLFIHQISIKCRSSVSFHVSPFTKRNSWGYLCLWSCRRSARVRWSFLDERTVRPFLPTRRPRLHSSVPFVAWNTEEDATIELPEIQQRLQLHWNVCDAFECECVCECVSQIPCHFEKGTLLYRRVCGNIWGKKVEEKCLKTTHKKKIHKKRRFIK